MKEPQELICACCGKYTYGRQYWNQDNGYSLCKKCADWIEEKDGKEYLESCYGKRGVHFDIPESELPKNWSEHL